LTNHVGLTRVKSRRSSHFAGALSGSGDGFVTMLQRDLGVRAAREARRDEPLVGSLTREPRD
jgi:hypothetical protein